MNGVAKVIRRSSGVALAHETASGDRTSESGFTLVEVVVALAIMAMSFGVLFGVISDALRQTDGARNLAQAGSLAQSLLARLGTEVPIAPGKASGEFSGGFRWRLRVEPYGDATDRQSSPVAAYTVAAEVMWGDGAPERFVVLNTLRLAPRQATR